MRISGVFFWGGGVGLYAVTLHFQRAHFLRWCFPHILPTVSNTHPELFINCCQTLKTFPPHSILNFILSSLLLALWLEKQMITKLWEALEDLCSRRESSRGERRDCRVEKQNRFQAEWLCIGVTPSCDNSVQTCKKRGLAAGRIAGLVTGKEWWFLETVTRVCPSSSKCCQETSLPMKTSLGHWRRRRTKGFLSFVSGRPEF